MLTVSLRSLAIVGNIVCDREYVMPDRRCRILADGKCRECDGF